MNPITRKLLISATALALAAGTLSAQASPESVGIRVAGAAGQYLVSTGGALLDEVRREIAAGIQPKLQRLPTVVVTPSDEELRDAGIDPKQFRAAKKAR